MSLAGIVDDIADRTNPVVVKELRQAVQSRFVIAILLLFLLANVVGVCLFVANSTDLQQNERAGLDLFMGLYGLLVVTCTIFVPLYTASRMTMERLDQNIDLVFITTIKPSTIVIGKFWSAAALSALIYSACAPFLVMTYLLRGIDLPSIFYVLTISFAGTLVISMIAIFAGCVTGGLLLRLLLAGGLLYAGGLTLGFSMAYGMRTVEVGVGSMLSGREGLLIHGLIALATLGGTILAYLLAVAALSPRSTNRMYPVRIYLTLCWVVSAIIAVATACYLSETGPMIVWTAFTMSLIYFLMPLILAERETWSQRVRRTIPRPQWRRMLAFLFYTGSAGGILWSLLLGGATLQLSFQIMPYLKSVMTPSYFTADEMLGTLIEVLLYVWCYTMSGLFLRRLLVPRSQPVAGIIMGLLLLGLIGSIPMLIAFFVKGPNTRFEDLPAYLVIANPFMMLTQSHTRYFLSTFLVVWACLGFLVNLPWFSKQWAEFQPYTPRTEPMPPVLIPQDAVANG